ncbi:MAG: class 1 fructose-bisphosphatase [Deltaproteobacteria bacterium]|nr:class 1 fructose-bisphosphatase [Deltaproteobacteria bacterium]
MAGLMTLSRYNLQRKREYEGATGDFTLLISHLALACKVVSREVARAGLLDVLGHTGTSNVQGEQVTKLDVLSNELLIEVLNDLPMVAAVASEEDEQIRLTRAGRLNGRYLVCFDPLDGSSNIDVNVTIGTIFSIRKRDTVGREATAEDFLKAGSEQIAAGYCIYGSSTIFVYSTGDGVDGFTLDPNVGEFVLSHPDMRIPDPAVCWSANVGNARNWSAGTHAFMARLTSGEGRYKKCSLRYVGTLVADVHRNLLQGGVFFYPGDQKSPKGKLRVLYEAHPLAYLVEQAGGKASDGVRRILDIVPDGLHMRTPLIIGSGAEVDLYGELAGAT